MPVASGKKFSRSSCQQSGLRRRIGQRLENTQKEWSIFTGIRYSGNHWNKPLFRRIANTNAKPIQNILFLKIVGSNAFSGRSSSVSVNSAIGYCRCSYWLHCLWTINAKAVMAMFTRTNSVIHRISGFRH